MRQHLKVSFLKIPRHILIKNDLELELEFFVTAWKKAKNKARKDFVIRGLLAGGGRWDAVTRSCLYYSGFEIMTNRKFPELWRQP